jgi:hypothetical protein
MGRRTTPPPEEITLVYRPVGPSHVFTANGPEMSGFHISHPHRKVAFELAVEALGKHVALIYGVDTQYELERSYDDFETHLRNEIEGNQVTARIAHTQARLQPAPV